MLPLALALFGCATAALRPLASVAERARAARSYSAELTVGLKGRELRGRSRALVAFARPDSLRVEVPGPTGARLVAIATGGRLVALFPSERGAYASAASAEEFQALLGIALTPGQIGDLLLGQASAGLADYEASWGPLAPLRIRATLPDGARLRVSVRAPELDAEFGPAVFDLAVPSGYRALAREEARLLWSRR